MESRPPLPARLVSAVLSAKPLIFAFGFLAPFVAQSLKALNVPLPDGVAPLAIGLALAALWGGIAQWTGRWI